MYTYIPDKNIQVVANERVSGVAIFAVGEGRLESFKSGGAGYKWGRMGGTWTGTGNR